MKTIDKIITKVNSQYGAPMGRPNIDNRVELIHGGEIGTKKLSGGKVFDCRVPMSNDGAYDKGGAYWGIGKELRVRYTKDLSFVEFYRVGDTN
jgi:hypothetical protein